MLHDVDREPGGVGRAGYVYLHNADVVARSRS